MSMIDTITSIIALLGSITLLGTLIWLIVSDIKYNKKK